ncbi:MAG: hypothetical protein JWN04_1901 [Myxococcaceae bacterium]|nr:hypothetical protein [Myxococcaceae bacterium]
MVILTEGGTVALEGKKLRVRGQELLSPANSLPFSDNFAANKDSSCWEEMLFAAIDSATT